MRDRNKILVMSELAAIARAGKPDSLIR